MQTEQPHTPLWARICANAIASSLIVFIAAYAGLRGFNQLLTVPESLFLVAPIAVIGTVVNKVRRRSNLPFIATLVGACTSAQIVEYFEWGFR
jgi:hypothetical protein